MSFDMLLRGTRGGCVLRDALSLVLSDFPRLEMDQDRER